MVPCGFLTEPFYWSASLFLRDFFCETCDKSFEEYVSSSVDRQADCSCGKKCEVVPSVPRVGVYSMMSSEGQKAALKKRSHDDTMRSLKKEPERHGFTAASQNRWNLRNKS